MGLIIKLYIYICIHFFRTRRRRWLVLSIFPGPTKLCRSVSGRVPVVHAQSVEHARISPNNIAPIGHGGVATAVTGETKRPCRIYDFRHGLPPDSLFVPLTNVTRDHYD